MRAVSMLAFDAWWDQVPHAIGGLYSATYPPLLSWMQAFCMKLFGESPFALRLFPAVCGGVSLFLLYGIAKRCVSRELSILSAIVLAGSVAWVDFSRLGMTDVPLVTSWLWALFSLIRIVETKSSSKRVMYAGGLAAAIAMSLLLKISISAAPLAFSLVAIWYHKSSSVRMWIVLAVLVGVSIASPWYLYMAQTHGEPFTQALFLPHVSQAVENSPSLPWWFYVNQLLVSHPFMLMAPLWLLFAALGKLRVNSCRQPFVLSSLLMWFFGGLVVLSAASTKQVHYTVLLIPAACILAMQAYELMLDELAGTRRTLGVLIALVVVSAWTLMPEMRIAIKSGEFASNILLLLPLAAILAGVVFLFLPRDKREFITVQSSLWLVYIIPGLMLLNTLNEARVSGVEYNDGADQVGAFLRHADTDEYVYLFHKRNEADEWNPQLAWYSHGWHNGWLPGKSIVPAPLQEHALQMSDVELSTIDLVAPEKPIVYYTSNLTPEIRRIVTDGLSSERDVLLETNRYTVFSPMLEQ